MKVLHPIGGPQHDRPRARRRRRRSSRARVVAVVGHQREQVGPHIQALVPDALLAVQETQDGTGHAVRVALEALPATATARAPCWWRTATPRCSRARPCATSPRTTRPPQRAVSILTGVVADPFGYGRIVRDDDGRRRRRSSRRRTPPPSSAAIREINSGILAFDADVPRRRAAAARQRQRQGRVLPHRRRRASPARTGCAVGAFAIDDVLQTEGANDRAQLAALGRELNRRIVDRWMRDGRHGHRPGDHLDRRRRACSRRDVTILPGVQLLGATVVARGRRRSARTRTLKDCRGRRRRARSCAPTASSP